MSVEDILARRIRLLFLDARIAIELAPMVASIMAPYLEKDKNWEAAEVATMEISDVDVSNKNLVKKVITCFESMKPLI